MVEETLKYLPLADWEISFICRHCRGSTETAVRMAAEHLLRNAAMAGRDLTPIRQAFARAGWQLDF
jgi:hypothetical protein